MHAAALERGIADGGGGGGAARFCLQELRPSLYFAIVPDALELAASVSESIPGGPTTELAAGAARAHGVYVHASLYETAEDGGLGYNTAIVVGPDGDVVRDRRRKSCTSPLPAVAKYYEGLSTLFPPR